MVIYLVQEMLFNGKKILFQSSAKACRQWWRCDGGCGRCIISILCSLQLIVSICFIVINIIQNVTEVKRIVSETNKKKRCALQ